MNPLVRLQRLSDFLEFGAIDATKKLIRSFPKRGVQYNRWGLESKYSHWNREIQVPRKAHAGKPLLDLWHETGHDLTRKVVQGSPAAIQYNPAVAARGERQANRAAIHAMNKLGGGEELKDAYRGYAQKHYQSYRPTDSAYRSLKKKIPVSAFIQ